ncbi:hypothetical protein PHABIO_287 [Pseudomonas phage Phabio]|uniref:Uncharacterized protein n=1 Tax=Pseudomonas phage Phabio TaxID=2006668 RepID=A0A1Y0T0A6_9CAUD|nr:hypothetical protein MZD05_gp287 [Pseudomonas phage Phabio]ARV76918.1 hypothetical protein PHABIO_287 [Pseudomonas phage Phabio]
MNICLRKDTYTQIVDLISAQMGLVINEDDPHDVWVSYIQDGLEVKRWGKIKWVDVHPVQATCGETIVCTYAGWNGFTRYEGHRYFKRTELVEMCEHIYAFIQSEEVGLPEGATR